MFNIILYKLYKFFIYFNNTIICRKFNFIKLIIKKNKIIKRNNLFKL